MLLKYTTKEVDLLARIMRAEALNDGDLAMLMVGNVVINRALANCLTFKNIRTISEVIYQQNQYAGINSSLFNGSATKKALDLAKRLLKGEYYYPATNSLWFYAPKTGLSCVAKWYEQEYAGKYKSHCFYKPLINTCPQIY